MTKYHFNPATGKSGRCTASVKDCPLVKQYADGQVAHFDTKAECDAFGEKVLEAQYEFEMKRTLQKKKKEYDTAQLNYDLSQNQHTTVSPATNHEHDDLMKTCAEQESDPMGLIPHNLARRAIENSDAVFLTKKPDDEVYDSIAVRGYFNESYHAIETIDTKAKFYGEKNVEEEIASLNFPFSHIDNTMKPQTIARTANDTAVANLSKILGVSEKSKMTLYEQKIASLHHKNQESLPARANSATGQNAVKSFFDDSSVPSVSFSTDISTVVDNASFDDDDHMNLNVMLTYTRESNNFAKKLDLHENNAVAFWTGAGSDFVNSVVHDDKPSEIFSGEFHTSGYISTLNSAIHRSDASEKIVYRGVPYRVVTKTLSEGDHDNMPSTDTSRKFMEHYNVGQEITFKTPQSTTCRSQVAVDFASSDVIYAIKSKTNAPVGTISAYGTREHEYLIPSDVKYQVTGKRTKNTSKDGTGYDICVIEMEEI